MISDIEQTASAQPELQFVRPIGDEFQIGEYLIRRMRGGQFLIWNRDGEMMQTRHGQLEAALQEFFNEEF